MGSTGASRGISTRAFGKKLWELTESADSTDFDALRRQMGQTGLEAGDPRARSMDKLYVNTGKSTIINAYLNNGKDFEAARKADAGWKDLVTERWVKDAIAKLDRGMAKLPQEVALTRFVDAKALGEMLPGMGIARVSTLIRHLESGKISSKDFATVLKNADVGSKGYLSTSTVADHPSYADRDVRLNIIARAGTPAIITKNTAESEVVLGRGLKQHFTGGFRIIKTSSGKKQLVLDVYV